MTEIFLKLLNMSIAASWLVLAVIILRVFLKKSPRWITCLLWGIVALRLVMPFTFESAFSLIPSPEVIPLNVTVTETPAIYSGIPAVNSAVNPLFIRHIPAGGRMLENIVSYAAVVWLAGFAIMLLYGIGTYLKLRHQVKASILYRENTYICDDVESPFLLGFFRPRIYIPSGVEEAPLGFVLAHENAHLKRRDHWWKPLGFVLLAVYWFNPLLWIAYILLCRDIEKACDEKVIAGMGPAGKVGYSEALAACSTHRKMIMVCPVAFGEISVKTRIKGVLNYKKPAFWIICASVVMCVITAVCFLTDPIPCLHTYHGEDTVASTCTEQGVQTLTCQNCQHSYTVHADLLAHTYDEGVVTLAPTCVEHGNKVFSCTGCGKKITSDLDTTPHTLSAPFVAKEPNCAETGEECATCTYCKDTFVIQTLATNGVHDLQETVVREATCAKAGEGEITCTRCDYTESCTYEKLEHTLKSRVTQKPTCSRFGQKKTYCTECGYFYYTQMDTVFCDLKYWGNGKLKCSYCGWITSANNSSSLF